MSNHLAGETSPYLLQHEDNPVNWYPWGTEALERARVEDKPIFLSIGYAACHWCHVMAHESFEDAETAAYLDEHFISIKVDREERPDLDHIYMAAVTALTGQGGWPMTVFLTPEGKPFHGGTYFPPEPRYGMPSFRQLLESVAGAWRERRAELAQGADRLLEAVVQNDRPHGHGAELSEHDLQQATRGLLAAHDQQHGGWGEAPKFPQPMSIEFLMRRHAATGEALLLTVAERALRGMARGGIYDQLGGGFHRYSVDAVWLVPHFEKMLYDNSQLARVYLHAWQLTGRPFYRRVCEETLDYVRRELTHPRGGFFSTQDADSEGEEGTFYVWQADEIARLLGSEADLFRQAYGVTPGGNWEGRNILHLAENPEALARRHEREVAEVEAELANSRRRLLQARGKRVRPARDDKIVTAWNGLMLAAFAEAARVLDRDDYRSTALAAAEFARRELWHGEARLQRTWKDGRAKLNGYLEDYACLAEGLLELYQTTFDETWFTAARDLAGALLAHFADPDGGFFDTSHDHETLVSRPRELQDNATPSGNAMAATVLARLYALTGEARYAQAAEGALRLVGETVMKFPTGFAQWLCAADFMLGGSREVAIIGATDDPPTQALIGAAQGAYRPRQVVAVGLPGAGSQVPLLADRPQLDDQATAYVCQNFACNLPVTEPDALLAQLGA